MPFTVYNVLVCARGSYMCYDVLPHWS